VTCEPVPLESSKDSQHRRERLILLALSAVQFTTIVDFMVVMPLGPQFIKSLGINPSQFGLIVSSYTFAAGVAGLAASSIMDRFSRRAAFVVLYAGFLLGTLFCALAPTYHLLIAARVATGACGGILGGMAMTIVGDVFPDERRGRATGALMSAFALASVAGVPIGLWLGTYYGWHVPFVALVVIGAPILLLAALALPRLDDHIGSEHPHPIRSLVDTFTQPNHISAFALIVSLMIGSFAVIPYISMYLVANVGVSEDKLPAMYVVAGVMTLVSAPWIGRLADRHGKLRVYRVIAPMSACLLAIIANLPPAPTPVAIVIVGSLMVANAGRMIAAMAMITGSVLPERRGGFMVANASVQHIATGVGTQLAAMILAKAPDGRLLNYGVVGWGAAAITMSSLWFAGRVRSAETAPTSAEALSLIAAAEATTDAIEPLPG
jgi:predicted MFS family arabinose efflux permease